MNSLKLCVLFVLVMSSLVVGNLGNAFGDAPGEIGDIFYRADWEQNPDWWGHTMIYTGSLRQSSNDYYYYVESNSPHGSYVHEDYGGWSETPRKTWYYSLSVQNRRDICDFVRNKIGNWCFDATHTNQKGAGGWCDCVGLAEAAYESLGFDPVVDEGVYLLPKEQCNSASMQTASSTEPDCDINSPNNHDRIRSNRTIADNGVSDGNNGSGINKVDFFYNSSTWINTDGHDSDVSGNYSCTWNTTNVSDGTYSLTSWTYDRAKNYKDSTIPEVTVDNTKPQVSSTSPTDDATALPTLTTVSATMNENMKQSLNTGSYGISGGGGNATISFDPGWISSSTVRFSIHDPAAEEGNNLKCGATYTVTIGGFQDLAEDDSGVGNKLDNYSWHFHTSCPSVSSITPKDTLSLTNPVFVVKFIDPVAPMNKESTQSAFSINSNDVKLQPLGWEDDYTIKLKAINLKPNTTYTITIDGKKAKNTKGETLIGGDYKWEVRTGEK